MFDANLAGKLAIVVAKARACAALGERPGEHWVVALALQAQAGCPVTFSRTAETVEEGIYQVIVEYSEEVVGKKAFDHAIALVDAEPNDAPPAPQRVNFGVYVYRDDDEAPSR